METRTATPLSVREREPIGLRRLICEMGPAVAAMILAFASCSARVQAGEPGKGRATYEQYCASCHGNGGKGDGLAAPVLRPKPRNHTNAVYMQTLSDEYLATIIAGGGPRWGNRH